MGAFSDIAFLLIIFFVLTTTFAKFQGTTVNLPSGAEGESEENEKQITVVLDAGKIHLNDNPENLTIQQLEIKLEPMLKCILLLKIYIKYDMLLKSLTPYYMKV